MNRLSEADVEAVALEWLSDLGWLVLPGPDIAPDTSHAERASYSQVLLERRLRDALAQLNPELPVSSLDDAFKKLARPEGSTLGARNRAFHRMLVDGVTVEYRTADGQIRGAQARVIDFDTPENNDWLAVNQFTVTENRNTRRPDIILFLNGLPLGVIELKEPHRRGQYHRVRVAAAANLSGRAAGPVRHERDFGRVRRSGGPCRRSWCRPGVVPGLAHLR